jgi:hypothetical protein
MAGVAALALQIDAEVAGSNWMTLRDRGFTFKDAFGGRPATCAGWYSAPATTAGDGTDSTPRG